MKALQSFLAAPLLLRVARRPTQQQKKMAQWDARDARWIVADREDGKNVGSWHWEVCVCVLVFSLVFLHTH